MAAGSSICRDPAIGNGSRRGSTIGCTITIYNANDRRVDLTPGGGVHRGESAPVLDTEPPILATAGQQYAFDGIGPMANKSTTSSQPTRCMTVDAAGRRRAAADASSPASCHRLARLRHARRRRAGVHRVAGNRADSRLDLGIAGREGPISITLPVLIRTAIRSPSGPTTFRRGDARSVRLLFTWTPSFSRRAPTKAILPFLDGVNG